jgi:hypothetical protein
MTTARTDHYSDLSTDYLRKARLHLNEGDLGQASEKGWGAAATALKACAEERGLPHHRHWQLRANLRQLIDESGDAELSELFSFAEALHANFYEHFMSVDEVETYIGHIDRLVGKLRRLV